MSEQIIFDDWDFSLFNSPTYKKQHSQTKLYKVVLSGGKKINKYYNELILMLNIISQNKKIKIKGGIKYAVAKFINRYHKLYKWNKKDCVEELHTCCVHYPRNCKGYYFCNGNKYRDLGDDECYCSLIENNKKHKIIWSKLNYDDNCMSYHLQMKSRYFTLEWMVK
jgi:hypothetical protein